MSASPSADPPPGQERAWNNVFAAGGEMGRRIAAHDWAATPLGPVESWPQSLRTAVTICLHSRFPILLFWGEDLVMLYNDAYRPMLGASKSAALGRPGAEMWSEIWDVIGPMLRGVLAGEGATWSQDQLLLVDRYGFVEETYFTFSYSPIMDESGTPGGVFAAVTEDTERVVGARRLRTLSDLAANLVDVDELDEVARRAVKVLGENRNDIPFARLYLPDGDGLRLVAATGPDTSEPIGEDWPLAEVLDAGETRLVRVDRADDRQAAVTPVPEPGGTAGSAVLVTGLNPQRPVDDDYRSFVELLAAHVGTALAGARAYQQEHRRAEALAELDAAKSAFFANVSHELRTPLTLIGGPVRDALDDPGNLLTPQQRRRLELVDRNAGRLRRLVDTILDFTRIEAGRLVPDRVAVDLARFTREIAASFAPALERAGLSFEVDARRLPRPAYVDRAMWEKVVLNLLSNALKATLRGSVRLSLVDDDGQIRLTVTDTGVGIPPEELSHLFERFHRVARPAGRTAEGSGIGLALTRELVRLHDGEISADSAVDVGSTFTVRVPYGAGADRAAVAPAPATPSCLLPDRPGPAAPATATADGPAIATADGPADTFRDEVSRAEAPGPAGPPDAPRVLVVDDNADLRDYLTDLLAAHYRVEAVGDGRAALATLTRDPPDLVLADVMMPHLDGFGLLAAIRSRADLAHLPVVLLSARAGPEAAVEGLAAGADDYLVKPFSGTELVARIRANLERARSRLRQGAWATRLLESMTDGIFVADENAVVFQVNEAWTALTGYGQESAPYPPPYPWWPDPERHPAERALLDDALVRLLDEGIGTYELPFARPDGELYWVAVSATSVPDPERGRPVLVGTVHDVTAERAVDQRYRVAAALADRLTGTNDEAEVLRLTAGALGGAFGGTAYLIRRDDPDHAHTADGVVDAGGLDGRLTARLADAGRDDGPEAPGEVDGFPVRLTTLTREWVGWVDLAAPRAVTAGERLLGGLLGAAAGQALRRIEALARQDEITEGLRGAVREATERERAWRAEATARADQQRADRRFRTLVEASTAVVWAADASGDLVAPQPSWEAYTGQRWPGHAGTGWAAMWHPDDRARIVAAWREALTTDAPLFEAEGRLWHARSDVHRHVAVRAASQRDATGRIAEWIGTIQDTHDRVAAESAARRTAAISGAMLDSSPIGFGLVDTDLRYLQVNPALAMMNGRSAAEHLGRRPAETLPVIGERIERLMRRALAEGPIVGVEFDLSGGGPDTASRHLVASYFPIRISDTGELVGLGFTVVDVTERTRLLEALGEERARYERLAATDVLAVFGGEDDRITEANEAFLDMLGHTAEDVAAGRLTWPTITPRGWEAADQRALAELADSGRATAYDKEYLHSDGHRVPVLIGVVALERQPLRWLAYAADLTAERNTQGALRLFRALVERSGDFIAVASPDGHTIYVNPAGRRLVGLPDGEHGVPDLVDFAAPAVRRWWRDELIPTVLRTGHHRGESRLVRSDSGEPVEVDHETFTVTAGGGRDEPAYVAIVARDISDRQRALRQAEALARLAGALSAARGETAVIGTISELAPALLDALGVRVATVVPGGTVLHVADGESVGELDINDSAPLARAVRENIVVPLDPDAPGSVGEHGLSLPMRYGDGRSLGALEVHWGRPVDDDEALRNLLDTVAGLSSQALQRAELTGSAQAMADFAARLSVTRSTTEAIEVILTAAPVVLGAALPGLAIHEEGRRVRLWYHNVPENLGRTFDDLTLDDPRPITTALRTGERIILHDRVEFAERFPGLPDPVGEHGLVTTAALPLLDAQRRPIAALAFGWRRYRRFRESDLALLDTIADLCEQTLERTRLAAAEHNLVSRLAGRLHASARSTPTSLEIAVRYRPAMTGLHLGGDWYDLIRLDGDRLGVVVGDVVGHQVEAAADMAQLRTMVNTLIRLGVPLEEVFPRLTELVGVGFLGTCLAMIVDPDEGRIDVVRAGHPHPVLLRSGRPPEPVLTLNAMPLGMVREPMPVATAEFGPGDLLVAYTDGLVERRTRPYDTGVAELHDVLVSVRDEPVETIADRVLSGLGGSDDDQALVVIRHTG